MITITQPPGYGVYSHFAGVTHKAGPVLSLSSTCLDPDDLPYGYVSSGYQGYRPVNDECFIPSEHTSPPTQNYGLTQCKNSPYKPAYLYFKRRDDDNVLQWVPTVNLVVSGATYCQKGVPGSSGYSDLITDINGSFTMTLSSMSGFVGADWATYYTSPIIGWYSDVGGKHLLAIASYYCFRIDDIEGIIAFDEGDPVNGSNNSYGAPWSGKSYNLKTISNENTSCSYIPPVQLQSCIIYGGTAVITHSKSPNGYCGYNGDNWKD